MFEEIDPGRAARCQYRQFHILVSLQITSQTVQQLRTFLHDGQVGGKVSVKDLIETQTAQGRNHLASNQGSRLHAELLSKGGAYRGSGLHDDFLGRVHQGLDNLACIVHLGQGSRGADGDALSAEGTVAVHQPLFEGGSDHSHEAAVHGTQGTYALHVITHGLATAAHHAFVHIPLEGRRAIFLISRYSGIRY